MDLGHKLSSHLPSAAPFLHPPPNLFHQPDRSRRKVQSRRCVQIVTWSEEKDGFSFTVSQMESINKDKDEFWVIYHSFHDQYIVS